MPFLKVKTRAVCNEAIYEPAEELQNREADAKGKNWVNATALEA